MKKSFFSWGLYVLTLLICSCKSSSVNNSFNGDYINTSDVGYTKLTLMDSMHFEYKQIQGLSNLSSKGTYEIQRNNLILNSFKKFKENYVEIVEKSLIERYSVISLIGNDNQILKEQILYFNSDYDNEYITDVHGSIKVKKKIKNISIITISGEYLIELEKEDYFNLKIKIAPENNIHFFFNNDTLKIRKNKITINNPKAVSKLKKL